MKRFLVWLVLLAVPRSLWGQNYAPPPVKPPDEATLQAIKAKKGQLGRQLETLRQQGVRDPFLADVEIYHKAADWIVRHNEFYQPQAGQWTLEVIDRGLLRASQLGRGESPWYHQFGASVVRAYRSALDGSVQPFAVTYPKNYATNMRKRWRVDVVLHGRDTGLTEVKFLNAFSGDAPAAAQEDFVRLDIFGRGNNAYRWAGEADVNEAIEAFLAVERSLGRGALLDPAKWVLRGFSMGGAGTWHLGLHRPDRWCVLGPGAGFTTTHGYIKNLPEKLAPEQEACLHIYDAVDYAENAFNVPVVAYSGSKDPQMQAAVNIETSLKAFNIPMQHLIAPDMEHRFPPEWQKKAQEAYAKFASKGRPEDPARVRFVTWTMKYPACEWVEILAMDRHYRKALVDATGENMGRWGRGHAPGEKAEDGATVKTQNVRALRLGFFDGTTTPQKLKIDGQELKVRPWPSGGLLTVTLERGAKGWREVLPQAIVADRFRQVQKVTGLQGPIDDAFTTSFLCVRGTGTAWHKAAQDYAAANLTRFQEEWHKYFRGELPVKDDVDVYDDDMARCNLILFGDPASNSLIAQVIDRLPLKWSKENLTLNGKTYAAAEHVPALIYPSPLHTARYVVLNSGHTFHAEDFRGTNALLYPRLGDYAVLKLKPTETDPLAVEVATAGLFDDFWQFDKK